MQFLRAIWFRLRSMLKPATLNAEFDEELNFHIDRETQENIKRGMSAADARRTALAQFGGVERFKEGLRDEHGVRWLDDLSADVRHSVRLLRWNALFSISVIATLALGIGATSTIFTIVNGVLLQSLPYAGANRIMSLSELHEGKDIEATGQRAFRVWSESARSFSSLGAFYSLSEILTGAGDPVEIRGSVTSASFFSVFGVRPYLGRTYSANESRVGSAPVVVLSHSLWKSAFGGDSNVLNRAITLNGAATMVIGVMPPEFGAPWRAKYWTPLRVVERPNAERSYTVIARLRPGVDSAAALRELRALVPRVDSVRPAFRRGEQPKLMSLHDRVFGSVTKPLMMLLSAVGVLLLIACANVANLTLARSAARQREFAVRLALGAGRMRLVRQLLVESSLLAGIGGLLGAFMPFVFANAFITMSPSSVARVTDIHVDATVVLFTAAITVLAALLFGLFPALTGARGANASSLAAGANRNAHARAHNRLRASLIVAEVSAALVLLTGAGLLTKSFRLAMAVNPGFVAENAYVASFNLPRARYLNSSNADAFFANVTQRVRALPGVDVVSVSGVKPLGGMSMTLELPKSAKDSTEVEIGFMEVDGNFGDAAHLHLIAGRFINEHDVHGSQQVAVITRSTARAFFPEQNPVGQMLPALASYSESASKQLVVGVVDDLTQMALDVKPIGQILLAGAQAGMWPQHLIVRTSIRPEVLHASLKRIVADVDPLQPITSFSSLQDDLNKSVAPRRFNSLVISAFAGLALLLASIGIYGLLANAVASRTREIGIRLALGAPSLRVLSLVLKQGMSLVGVGVVIGLLLSLALSRTVSSLLYEVPAQDPTIFAIAALSLSVVALLACYIPARRATLVSPTTALRHD